MLLVFAEKQVSCLSAFPRSCC